MSSNKLTDDAVLAEKLGIEPWDTVALDDARAAEERPEIDPLKFKPQPDYRLPMPKLAELPTTPPRNIYEVCRRYVWVRSVKRFVDRLDGEMLDVAQFDSEFNYLTERHSISKDLHKTPQLLRRFKSVVFNPGRPEFDGDTYNTWRESAVVPIKGDTSIWHAHLKWLLGDEREREMLLDWMAWVLQNPSQMPKYAVLIVGEQTGTGKSMVARVMEQLVGPANTKRPKNSSLKGQFNSWAWKSRLIIFEELHAIGRREVANELRDVLTEESIEINIKMVPQFVAPTFIAGMGLSNHPDALPIPKNDRRWLVLTSTVSQAEKDKAIAAGYFKPLVKMLDRYDPDMTALGAIAYELMNRDVRHFQPGDAPMTAGKQEMTALSNSPLETWLDENRSNDPFTRRVVNIRYDLAAAVPPDIQHAAGNSLETMLRKFIKSELDGVALGDVKVNGKVRNLWAINDWGVEAKTQGVDWFKEHRDVSTIYKSQNADAAAADATEPWDV